jgi:hypothetical protein
MECKKECKTCSYGCKDILREINCECITSDKFMKVVEDDYCCEEWKGRKEK